MECSTCGQEHVAIGKGRTRKRRPCKGHKRYETIDGQRVLLPTPVPCSGMAMLGQDVCHAHGGKAPQNRAAGVKRETERKARAMAHKWGVPIDTTPTDAILNQVKVWSGIELYYRERVDLLTDDERIWGKTKTTSQGVAVAGVGIETAEGATEEAKPNVWLVLHAEASQNLVRFAAEAIKAGIEERRVRLAEQQGALVADVIRRILDELGLTEAQAARSGEVVVRHLRLLTG